MDNSSGEITKGSDVFFAGAVQMLMTQSVVAVTDHLAPMGTKTLQGLPSNTLMRSPSTPRLLPSTFTSPLPEMKTMQVSRFGSMPFGAFAG